MSSSPALSRSGSMSSVGSWIQSPPEQVQSSREPAPCIWCHATLPSRGALRRHLANCSADPYQGEEDSLWPVPALEPPHQLQPDEDLDRPPLPPSWASVVAFEQAKFEQETRTSSSPVDVAQHNHDVRSKSGEFYHCSEADCERHTRGFDRVSSLVDHIRHCHQRRATAEDLYRSGVPIRNKSLKLRVSKDQNQSSRSYECEFCGTAFSDIEARGHHVRLRHIEAHEHYMGLRHNEATDEPPAPEYEELLSRYEALADQLRTLEYKSSQVTKKIEVFEKYRERPRKRDKMLRRIDNIEPRSKGASYETEDVLSPPTSKIKPPNSTEQAAFPRLYRCPINSCGTVFTSLSGLLQHVSQGSEHRTTIDAVRIESISSADHSEDHMSGQDLEPASLLQGREVEMQPELHKASLKFAAELARRIIASFKNFYQRGNEKDESGSVTAPAESNTQTVTGSTQASAISSSSKRQRSAGKRIEDASDSDDEARPSKARRKEGGDRKHAKLFACPYTKFNPARFSERNTLERIYRCCSGKYVPTISRVKQHLGRNHTRPHRYCGRCYKAFESREEQLQHDAQHTCSRSTPKYEEKMTDEQYQSICSKKLPNTAESWHTIFEILFSDASKPASPFVSVADPAAVSQFIGFFRWCEDAQFESLHREWSERRDVSGYLDSPAEAIVEEAFEIALALRNVRSRGSDMPLGGGGSLDSAEALIPGTLEASTDLDLPPAVSPLSSLQPWEEDFLELMTLTRSEILETET